MSRRLDIIIVSYNTKAETLACLGSLFAAPPAELGQVFVVDNDSTDGSVEAIRKADWPAVELITLSSNLGFGAANNTALRRSSAPLVLFLNSDAIAPPGAIDTLVERLLATGAVAAGPRLESPTGQPEISFGRMLTPIAEMGQSLRGYLAQKSARWAQRRVGRYLSTEQVVDWVSGACLLVERRAAVEAGLFDERFFLYEEDVDFCAALRAAGGRILFTPRATVVHRRGRSNPARRAHYDRSHLAFYEKHAPNWVPWLRLWQRVRGRRVR